MSNILKFKEEDVQKGEDYFKSIHIEPEQRQIVTAIAELLSKFTGLRVIALKGFILMVFRQWQIDNNKEIRVIATAAPSERIAMVTDLFNRLDKKLSRILKSDGDKEKLTNAINSGLDFYKSQFANR